MKYPGPKIGKNEKSCSNAWKGWGIARTVTMLRNGIFGIRENVSATDPSNTMVITPLISNMLSMWLLSDDPMVAVKSM